MSRPMRTAVLVAIVFLVLLTSVGFLDLHDGWIHFASKPLTLVAVGDSIGYNVPIVRLSGLKGLIGSADIFIFNLEGVLNTLTYPPLKCEGFPRFQSILTSDASFAKYMKLAPLTIANMANNHILDCGAEGIRRTKQVLLSNNILSLGAGLDQRAACEPLILNIRDEWIAFVSYNFAISELVSASADRAGAATLAGCRHSYQQFRSEGVDLIVASIHYGSWSSQVTPEQVRIVDQLFNSGIDLVLGHSPHMPQAILAREGKLVFFSLGNFIFRPDYRMPTLAYTSIVPRITYFENRIDVILHPILIDEYGIPRSDSSSQTIERITKASTGFNTYLVVQDNVGYLSITRGSTDISHTAETIQPLQNKALSLHIRSTWNEVKGSLRPD